MKVYEKLYKLYWKYICKYHEYQINFIHSLKILLKTYCQLKKLLKIVKQLYFYLLL